MLKQTAKTLLGAVLVAALALLATGCQQVAEKAAEEATEAAVENATGGKVEIDEGSVSVETEQGEKVEIGSGKLPEGFPENVPVEKDVKILASAAAPDGDRGTGYTLSYLTKTEPTKAIADYKAALVKEGWKITMEAESEGTAYLSAETKDRQLSATIAAAENEPGYKTLVNIVEVPLVK